MSVCKAAADQLRLRILRLLSRDAMDVSELCEVLDVRQSALSHHLKLMSNAGLLSTQRDGNHIFYRRRQDSNAEDALSVVQQALFTAADHLQLNEDVETRRTALQRKREERSLDFFRLNAHRFREQQDLIAAPERYAATVNGILDTLALNTQETAIEVGPGEGWLLPKLSRLFNRVVALDNAPNMLRTARDAAERAALGNVEFIAGDTSHPDVNELDAELVVINMVLHHTPDPARTLREAAASLAPSGVLLLTELCEHSQGWTRENCGDLWLGFTPQQISDWTSMAGLQEITGSYLGQRNGFKLQVRLFGAPPTFSKK